MQAHQGPGVQLGGGLGDSEHEEGMVSGPSDLEGRGLAPRSLDPGGARSGSMQSARRCARNLGTRPGATDGGDVVGPPQSPFAI